MDIILNLSPQDKFGLSGKENANCFGGILNYKKEIIKVALSVLLFIIIIGCSSDSPTEPEPAYPGSWYSLGIQWAHDGDPYETENFIVYSDAASREARETLADIAEEMLSGLKLQMDIQDNSILVFPAGQRKIHIYGYKNHFPTEWGGRAYFGGLMIYSLDHPERTAAGHTDLDVYEAVVKHELTHVVQYQLLGTLDYNLVDSWFSEGIAEKISESNPDRAVTTLERLESLVATYGELNPISIKRYNYPDIEYVAVNYYYPMFQLAANYLLDPPRNIASWVDVKEMFLEIRNGGNFTSIFKEKFGIELTEFESRFFDLMREYLH